MISLLTDIRDRLPSGGGGSIYDDMGTDRIARLETSMSRLEGAFDGLKHVQTLTLSVISIAVALAIFGGGYVLTRVDALSTRIEALPGQISSDIQELNRTLSQSITAARSVESPAPVVIQLPDSFVGTSAGGDGGNEITRPDGPGTENQTLEFQQQRN
ncbi:hypothetical protein H9Q09_00625 [Aurantimonas sp. DM33-3]|uniref:hypothetical protein n=1 Tax=Aurantimonas sp. DM33-3 TaxID=2766955 RepID=UPI001651EC3E|nr:hypothetical protein [Aurantimonas sp. DM33-3]MBC6714689.1 hypothetical protein [Aurantimonas sp. DM33-3]